MASVRVRQDVWELGDDSDPWRDGTLLAYAKGVRAMQELDSTSPTDGRGWVNQAAIHGTDNPAGGRLEEECQHGSWFFLPWHRMYLYRFEEIVRFFLSDEEAETWALPYWNYTNSSVTGSRALPPAFREQTLPDGSPNPLFTSERRTVGANVNAGDEISVAATSIVNAFAEAQFSRAQLGATPGFGGRPSALRLHRGPGIGQLEGTPHGNVHVAVGGVRIDPTTGDTVPDGLMSTFETAALDPIFWLHHSNIDRLWEVWLRDRGPGNPPGRNPVETGWLRMDFDLYDDSGNETSMKVEDVLDTVAQLGYTYSHLPAAPPDFELEAGLVRPYRRERELGVNEEQGHPPEMIGASDEAVTLDGTTASASIEVSAPDGPTALGPEALTEKTTYLNIENIEGERNPGLVYGVYLNQPPDEEAEPESENYVGAISFFGIEDTALDDEDEEAPHGLSYVFNITELARSLQEKDQWDPDRLDVTFSPIDVDDATGQELAIPPVRVGRVSVFIE